eukprot:5232086-Prymnesium_polylepis.1
MGAISQRELASWAREHLVGGARRTLSVHVAPPRDTTTSPPGMVPFTDQAAYKRALDTYPQKYAPLPPVEAAAEAPARKAGGRKRR